jgi:osmotically-inducible protein OsmY
MANQNGWTDERRDGGGYEDGVRRAQRRPDRGDDYGARYDEGQSRADSSFDLRDDYRYGAGQGADYPYGRFAQGRYRPNADRGVFGDYNTGGYPQTGVDYSSGYGLSDNGRYGGGAYPARVSGYGAAPAYGTGSSDPRYGARRASPGGEPRSWWDRTSDEVSSWFGDDEAAIRRHQDERRADEGGHRGRGPKDYTRSDERIREDVNDRLTDDPHIDARTITVAVKDGEVTLSGTVNHRQDKRHAEDIAERVSGAKHVQNNLRVHDTNYDAQLAQAGSTSSTATTGASPAGGTRAN